VRKHLVSKIKKDVEEGATYVVDNILVAGNDSKYKITPHKYKLNCLFSINFIRIKDLLVLYKLYQD